MMRAANVRRRLGGATVELAVSMIFLVPLIMYMFFLQDMLLMKLNGQEAAVQAPWDYAVLNYEHQYNNDPQFPSPGLSGRQSPGHMSRLTYCDHSAAFDSYTAGDCDDAKHHQAMAAHECWVGDDASFSGQVRCTLGREPVQTTGAIAQIARFGNGGVVNCNQRLGIMNYYLPNSFLNNFRGGQGFKVNQDSTGQEKKKFESRWANGGRSNEASRANQDQVHGEDGAGNPTGDVTQISPSGDRSAGSNYWRLRRTENAMLVDPWAVTLSNAQYLGPMGPGAVDTGHPIGARIQATYGAAGGTGQAVRYNGLMQQAFLNGSSASEGAGDDLSSASGAFRPRDARQNFGGFSAGQWSDARVQNSARGAGYFGLGSW